MRAATRSRTQSAEMSRLTAMSAMTKTPTMPPAILRRSFVLGLSAGMRGKRARIGAVWFGCVCMGPGLGPRLAREIR